MVIRILSQQSPVSKGYLTICHNICVFLNKNTYTHVNISYILYFFQYFISLLIVSDMALLRHFTISLFLVIFSLYGDACSIKSSYTMDDVMSEATIVIFGKVSENVADNAETDILYDVHCILKNTEK